MHALNRTCVVGRGLGLVVASLLWATPASAQSVLGYVFDSESGSPVVGAEVAVFTLGGEWVASGVSDQDGRFFLPIDREGKFNLVATSLGYHANEGSTIELTEAGFLRVEVELAPDAIELPSLTVTQERHIPSLARRGYYSRRRQGLGQYVEPTDFEKNMHVPFRELLRRTPFFGGIRCKVGLIVNGSPSFQGISNDPRLRARYIAGIELYRSIGTAPARFQAMVPTACAFIVVWLDFTEE